MFTAIRFVIAIAILILYFANVENWLWRSLALFVFGCLTDVVDGEIARRTNTVSDLGKLLDPVCDKAMQIAMALVLALGGYVYLWVLIALVAKELLMVLGGMFFLKSKIVVSANWMGKFSTVWFSLAAVLAMFELKPYCDWAFIASVVLAYATLVQYGVKYFTVLKNTSDK